MKNNKLKMACKNYLCSVAFHQGFSPRKMLCKYEVNPQEHNHAGARYQQSCFVTLLKSYSHTDAPPKFRSTS